METTAENKGSASATLGEKRLSELGLSQVLNL